MLQRIQSVFLLLALVLLGLIFVLPFAVMVDAQANESVYSGVQMPALVLQIIVFVTTLATVFLYKNRVLQIRLSALNCVILLVYQAFAIWQVYQLSLLADATRVKVAIIFPVLAVILTLVAMRGMAKDEALVKSLDRLR